MAPTVPWGAIAWGIGGLVGGLVLVALGYAVVGPLGGTAMEVAAGTLVVIGMSVALVSVFMLLLPPLLPSR